MINRISFARAMGKQLQWKRVNAYLLQQCCQHFEAVLILSCGLFYQASTLSCGILFLVVYNMKPTKQRNHPDPIKHEDEVQKNPDKHMDQDFEGYPHHPAKDEIIKPETDTQKKTAGIHPKTRK